MCILPDYGWELLLERILRSKSHLLRPLEGNGLGTTMQWPTSFGSTEQASLKEFRRNR